MEDYAACLAQVGALLGMESRTSDTVTHVFDQLRVAVALQQEFQNSQVRLEATVAGFERRIDVQLQQLNGQITNIEIKTGRGELVEQLNIDQLLADARIAVEQGVQNVWALTRQTFGPESLEEIQEIMREVRTNLRRELSETLSGAELDEAVRQGMSSFNFVDSAGRVIALEFEGRRLESVFEEGMEILFGPDGTVTQVVTRAVQQSPNFEPAMEILFGPSGKVSAAATEAAAGANLEPAAANLENKIEEGVTEAMEGAGEAAQAAGAQALSQQITAGVGALGNVLTSVPQLYESVNRLGEAWDKPLNSTADYMNLMSALGGTISQGVQVFQAFQGVMQLATAAQAAFNIVAAMNPIVLIVLAVIALIAGIALLIVYWDQVKAALRDNPWIAVAAVLFGVIGIIIVIIAYWDEIKLAVLEAANFISIQVQRIGQFFLGIGRLAEMVWNYIVASLENAGIGIMNAFIQVGTSIQNFFIGVINGLLELYNEFATSAVGEFLGLEAAELIPEVDVQTRLIPPREVPEIDVDAAFRTESVTGGLEDQIAAQRSVVEQAQREDEERRRRSAEEEAAQAPAAPAASVPAAGLPPTLPTAAGAPAAAGVGAPDQSVRVEGGITVNINAERLEADAAEILSDEIIRGIQERLDQLRAESSFRTGTRAEAA